MSESAMSWAAADSWILAAIGVYHRPCSLAELIGSADLIRHTLPERQQLEEALGKLAGAGLVRIFEDWTFELTDDGMGLFSTEGRDLPAKVETASGRLTGVEPGRTTVRLPDGALEEAVELYRGSSHGAAS